MINSIGLPNKGLDGFLAEDLPQLAELPVPLIVSVMGTSREEFSRLVRGVGERDEVAAIELNVSCPNVHSGLIVGEQPAETEALLEALRPLTEKPLIVKLTPNVANPADVAVAAEQGGADAVSLINTLKASAIDPATGEPGIAAGHGGLSGPAVRPIAVAQLRAVAAAVQRPDRRDGRGRQRRRRGGNDRRGSDAGRGRHRELPRPTGRKPGCKRDCRSAQERFEVPVRSVQVAKPRLEVKVNFGANGSEGLARRRPAAILAAHMPAPQSRPPPQPPRDRSTSGWMRSNAPTTSAPREPS